MPSDGYATGLAALALEESGTSRKDQTLTRGLDWLERHQGDDGSLQASSVNRQRDLHSDIGRFMSDAATAYAMMALEKDAGNRQKNELQASMDRTCFKSMTI